MKAIILAAGRGSRMKRLTENRPKCLIKINGKTLLDMQLESLLACGIKDIAIITGYKQELLSGRGLVEFNNPRWAETQVLHSLTHADSWLFSEPCIVTYSDIFYATSAITDLIKNRADIALTYDQNWLNLWETRFGDPLIDAESFRLTSNNIITEIGKRPKTVDEIDGQFMGLLKFTPSGWNEVCRIRSHHTIKECDCMDMTYILQKIIEAGSIKVSGVAYTAIWGEVDFAKDLLIYEAKTTQSALNK